MEAELCQARALPAGLGGSAAVVASQARWGHSTEASAERRVAPALTTYLMLQALLAHLYAHPHLLPPTAIYPASQHWPTGPSIASLSHSSTRASLQSPGSQLITPLLTHYVKPACRWEEPQHSGAGLLNSPRS